MAKAMGADPKKLADRANELAEFNPMLGFRGCRIAIAYPEIAEMQARAIFEAAVEAEKRSGKPVRPEIMVPLIATKAELDLVKARIDAMAKAVEKETGAKLAYDVGTMIELPRAALLAGEIAESAEFFSFGTNDLTQTTFGISRDDAASFLSIYTARGILPVDPFVSIDQQGVGELVRIGVEMLNKSGRRAQSLSPRRTLYGSHLPGILGKIAVLKQLFSWTKVPYDSKFFCGGYALLAAATGFPIPWQVPCLTPAIVPSRSRYTSAHAWKSITGRFRSRMPAGLVCDWD